MIKTGKILLSGGLILASGSYAWWQHMVQHPVTLNSGALTPGLPNSGAKPPAAMPVPAPQAVAMNPSVPSTAMDAPAEPAKPETAAAGRPQVKSAAREPAHKPASEPAPEPMPAAAPSPPPPQEPLNAIALAPPPAVSTGRYADGEFIGNAVDGEWGPVQVKVVVRNGDIADVIALEYPIHRQRSAEISEWAIPQLAQEVIKAQSANIDWITQASFTSENYQQSLASALARAKKQP
jgi:uncharacterized protein with FMN-binding domain